MSRAPGPGSAVDVAVIGGGQAGLAAGYFLRRTGADFVILDDRERPGGSWSDYWDSLRLFSPAAHSPLPGWWMPDQDGEEFPTADHVARYLTAYEQRYALPVRRPVRVTGVRRTAGALEVAGDAGTWRARSVISATGTWRAPVVPHLPGRAEFTGRQLHTASYRRPEEFAGQRVVVVGGGNSAAQILAEVSEVAETTWVTRRPPRFMPDDVDGRALFDIATRRERDRRAGGPGTGAVAALGDIVMVPSVREVRERGVLKAEPMFARLTRDGVAWSDGSAQPCDAVVWCTGFRPVLDHLAPLGLPDADGRVATEGTRSVAEPRLHLLGYGDWTGGASATLIGAGRTAKTAVAEITASLREGADGAD
ncbi:putative flavoprotein involved in K+ transport [Spinactinospora alkalitolerans]|uniref:Putative flavoprotein involved in K+ transport n=1 Tax=Spinactinospora alkalitolerans TaxID=687207 RepID=A0A852U8V4_9ACTN|nr:ArsO family NAD(P)H-dependent flavin-containing monooxygenase [Spinactinospora alkalitolerans]NYE50534.1 putative flavoprotein involved in K+ transport [Spinactinospora alkalitolerans]